jgi:hypothetical protein
MIFARTLKIHAHHLYADDDKLKGDQEQINDGVGEEMNEYLLDHLQKFSEKVSVIRGSLDPVKYFL